MNIRVFPGAAAGQVTAPPSKSIAHRALIAAALASGQSRVQNVGSSDDIEATLDALTALGARFEQQKEALLVTGCNPQNWPGGQVFCRESGSTLRFLLPVFAQSSATTTFTGAGRLMQRPQTVYRDLFGQMGLFFMQTPDAVTVKGPLRAGEYTLPGNVSSQFFSGLCFGLCRAKGDSLLHILPPFESAGYLSLTAKVLAAFGVRVELTGNDLLILGGQSVRPANFTVEGDYSGAAFFAVLGALCGEVCGTGLCADSGQSDAAVLPALRRLGANVRQDKFGFTVSRSALRGGEIDIADCPDLGPVLMAAGCFCENGLLLKNTARLRYKESDRAAAMQQELAKLGFLCEVRENEIFMPGARTMRFLPEYEVDSHKDHRIAMALAVTAAALAVPVVICGAECVTKSYPGFWQDLQRAGIKTEVLA